jgi:hypothetical protein
MRDGEVERDRRAHRQADQRRLRKFQFIEERQEIGDLRRKRAVDPRRSVSTDVIAHDASRSRQAGGHVVPLAQVHLKGMNQHNIRAPALELVVQPVCCKAVVWLHAPGEAHDGKQCRRDRRSAERHWVTLQEIF